MKRKLIRQMINEWRGNIWLIIELTLVSLVLWYALTYLLQFAAIRIHDYGYDISTDIYVGENKWITLDLDDFIPGDTAYTYQNYAKDLADIKLRLASNPYVELVGIGSNAMSYNYNFSGTSFSFREGDSIYSYFGNVRHMSPEVVEIFRLRGLNGETPTQLADALRRGEILPGHYDVEQENMLCDANKASGREIWFYGDTAKIFRSGPAVHTILRSDYEPSFSGMIAVNIPEDNLGEEMIIRVKPGRGREFMESLTPDMVRSGNVYVANITPVENLRYSAHIIENNQIRLFTIGAIFMLIVVLLGFLGTFWFRTQERIPEIAIRMVNGATPRDIFSRMIGEGFIMLIIASVISGLLAWICCHLDIITMDYTGSVYCPFIAIPLTALLLAIMIFIGVCIPASKAMKIDMAQVLKDQ